MVKSKKFIASVVTAAMAVAMLSLPTFAANYGSSYSDNFSTTSTQKLSTHSYSGRDISFTANNLSTNANQVQTFYVSLYAKTTFGGSRIGSRAICTSDVSGGGLTYYGANTTGSAKDCYWTIDKAETNGYSVAGTINSTSSTL